jgi:hypothetical protein
LRASFSDGKVLTLGLFIESLNEKSIPFVGFFLFPLTELGLELQ